MHIATIPEHAESQISLLFALQPAIFELQAICETSALNNTN